MSTNHLSIEDSEHTLPDGGSTSSRNRSLLLGTTAGAARSCPIE